MFGFSEVIDAVPVIAPSVLEALMYPDATAARLAVAVPQGLLVAALCALTPARLSVDGRIDTLLAVERHIAMLQARSTELLAALDLGDTTEDHVTRDTVAAALRLPPASMKQRMFLTRELVLQLPAALESLRAGDITDRHTAALADATQSLPPEVATAVETAVLARAPGQSATQFRSSLRRAVQHLSDPATEDDAHPDALTRRRVIVTPQPHGMTELWAFLPADHAALINTTLDATANTTPTTPVGTTAPPTNAAPTP